MQVSTAQAAERLGVSRRAASYAVREAGVVEEIGNALFVDELAVQMAERARALGRRWSEGTALAAFELLDVGDTRRLRADARSRLRSQLRGMDAAAIAHRARGVLGRVRRVSAPKGTSRLESVATDAAMSALGGDGLLALGLYGGDEGGRFMRMVGGVSRNDLVQAGIVGDAAGDIVLLAGAVGSASHARALVESYLLGDTRIMRAASDAITARVQAL